jgi:hypothetical protein
MKAFLKALPTALFPTIGIVLSAIICQMLLYGSKQFEDFFGVAVGKFNPLHYTIWFFGLWFGFALLFRSDYE